MVGVVSNICDLIRNRKSRIQVLAPDSADRQPKQDRVTNIRPRAIEPRSQIHPGGTRDA